MSSNSYQSTDTVDLIWTATSPRVVGVRAVSIGERLTVDRETADRLIAAGQAAEALPSPVLPDVDASPAEGQPVPTVEPDPEPANDEPAEPATPRARKGRKPTTPEA